MSENKKNFTCCQQVLRQKTQLVHMWWIKQQMSFHADTTALGENALSGKRSCQYAQVNPSYNSN